VAAGNRADGIDWVFPNMQALDVQPWARYAAIDVPEIKLGCLSMTCRFNPTISLGYM
jgi:hypothetical protein